MVPQEGMVLGCAVEVLVPAVRQAPFRVYHWLVVVAPVKSSV